MPRIILTGSVAYDRIMDFPGKFSDHILPDKIHKMNLSFPIERVVVERGGTAGNIAYGLSLLNMPADLAATVGADADSYISFLKDRGIGTDTVAVADGHETANAYLITDRTNNQISAFVAGACEVPYAKELTLGPTDIVMVSPGCLDDMATFPKRAKEAGATYFFDPGHRTIALSVEALRAGIEGCTALLVNDYELALIVDRTGWDEKELLERTGLLIVTLGGQGSRIVTKDAEKRVAAVKAAAVDPTGAGDAFRAGFLVGYVKGLPHVTSAKIGSALAAFAVEARGCQSYEPRIDALRERFEAAYGEPWPL